MRVRVWVRVWVRARVRARVRVRVTLALANPRRAILTNQRQESQTDIAPRVQQNPDRRYR